MVENRRFAQRELELEDVRTVIPWGGQSPRVLTTAYKNFNLAAEGMGRLDQDGSHVGELRALAPPFRGGQFLLYLEVKNG